MQVSYKWLQEYIPFEWLPDELAGRLTLAGTAVEKIRPLYERFAGIKVARIEDVRPHLEQRQLTVCTLDTGSGPATVVCGAPNVHPGQYSPYAPPEALLPGGTRVTVTEIGGVSSAGFLCSEAELGLSEEKDQLMVLDPESAEIGADLWEYLELDDWILTFELTPNRPDCLSVLGVAREVGALTGGKVRYPAIELAEGAEQASERVKIEIADPQGCPRYAARIIDKMRVGPSPFWLKRHLHSAGIRSINNIVDVTNYVMIETGQPLHAFDFDKFAQPQVLVRSAQEGEKFVTLDGETRQLVEGDVMITDSRRAVAIGGVMGGKDSEVAESTRTVLLESAYFHPAQIRRTRKRLGLDTESAARFEKGVDPNGVVFALDRAAALMARLSGAQVLRGAVDCYPAPIEPVRLDVRPGRVNKIIGMDLPSPKMMDILSALEFAVTAGKTISVTVPTFRPDVTREIDLIEEIARIAGYESIPVARRAAGRVPTPINPVTRFESILRNLLTAQGLFEAMTNSLVDPRLLPASDAQRAVTLRNPLSAELSVLRPSLVGSLLGVVAHNLNRQVPAVRIFELGRVFWKEGGRFEERRAVAIMLAGETPSTRWESAPHAADFHDLKGVLAGLFERLRVPIELRVAADPLLVPGASFHVAAGETVLGCAGLLDAELVRRYDVKVPAWGAFLEFDKLLRLARFGAAYRPVPKFPKSERDCAVVVDRSILAGDLVRIARQAGSDFIEDVIIFDIYTGPQVPPDKKSVAISIAYRAQGGTLTDEQVNAVHAVVIAALKDQFKAELRT